MIFILKKKRFAKTKYVSKIGIPKIIKGIKKDINCKRSIPKGIAIFHRSYKLILIAKTARIKPSHVDPDSPKKIEAEAKLYFKNPKVAPIPDAAIVKRPNCPLFKAKKPKNINIKKESPETSPSIPSSIFIEFVIKVIKQAVITIFIRSNLKKSNDIPVK